MSSSPRKQAPRPSAAPASSIRNAFHWINYHILARETRFRWLDVCYMVFALVTPMHHAYIALIFPAFGYEQCGTLWIVFAIVSILLGRMWRNRGFRLLSLLWLIFYLRLIFLNPDSLSAARPALLTGFYAIGGVYSVACVLKKEDHLLFLRLFCALWTLYAAFMSILGVYAAYTGDYVYNLNGSYIGIASDSRLYMIYYSVTSGTFVSMSAVLAMWSVFLFPQRWAKALFGTAAFFMLLANALTGTRTGFLISAAGIAFLICAAIYRRFFQSGLRSGASGKTVRVLLLSLCFVILTAILAYAQTWLDSGFTLLRSQGGLLSGRALAEESAEFLPEIEHRDFSQIHNLDNLTTGRVSIWRAAMKDILSSSSTLLLGRSLVNPMTNVYSYLIDFNYDLPWHCHNLLLQTALESGLPGLLILLVFIGWILARYRHGLRNPSLPLWRILSMAPLLAILTGEMAECTTIWAYAQPQLTLLYLSLSFVSSLGEPFTEISPA